MAETEEDMNGSVPIAAGILITSAVNPASEKRYAAACRELLRLKVPKDLVMGLQDAATEAAHAGRALILMRFKFAIGEETRAPRRARLEREIEAAERKLTVAWHLVLNAAPT